ncbi:MAG: glycosyltransferase family 2 protein [Prevotella sp.]|nr:glycosyltransferase family 2 protein [Candidatus Prevotella equi]
MKKTYNIAVIITCFNRCRLTVESLKALYLSRDNYNNAHKEEELALTLFLTDDGCTDGTAETVLATFPGEEINIVKGDGSLYWAGGMRKAWKAAMEEYARWHFYILLNDDTQCMPEALGILMDTQKQLQKMHGMEGIVSGVCQSPDGKTITYGAEYYTRPLIGKSLIMHPTGKPEPCYRTNANLVLVASNVVSTIGMFDDGFIHSCADWAYGIKACKAGLPVYITPVACAICDNDHGNVSDEGEKVMKMNLSERKAFFSHPLRATSDKLLFMKRYYKEKYLILLFARTLAVYMPSLYYRLLLARPLKPKK